MPQIRGIKGEAVPLRRDCEPLITKEMGYHPAEAGKGKQNGILFKMYISLIDEL